LTNQQSTGPFLSLLRGDAEPESFTGITGTTTQNRPLMHSPVTDPSVTSYV